VNKSASAFNPDKLLWLNQQHIMRSTPEHVANYLQPQLAALGVSVENDAKLAAIVKTQQERAKTLKEMAQNSVFFYREPERYDEKAAKKNLTADASAPLARVIEKLDSVATWSASAIHDAVNQVATELALGLGKVAQPIRVAVSGTSVSPPIDVTLEVLGKDSTLRRLRKAAEFCKQSS
jgi:glutamyl-tRNA synthetase